MVEEQEEAEVVIPSMEKTLVRRSTTCTITIIIFKRKECLFSPNDSSSQISTM
jgi:hypothetical protein